MAYRLEPGEPVGSEVRRIIERQVDLALDNLSRLEGRDHHKSIHGARRHIKKIRALVRLFQPSLGGSYSSANRRLRTVSRLLGPIADGEAVIDTLARIKASYGKDLPRGSFAAIQAGLVQLELRADRKAAVDRVLESARLLRAERAHAHGWLLDGAGFDAIAPGLEKSVRRARRAMALTLQHPTGERYHVWRRRVKDFWLQVRLLRGGCRDRLARCEAWLERLDGLLGEYYNCVLLQQVLETEPLVSRQQTARCLKLIRCYQAQLRREIRPLGARLSRMRPRRFVKRVRRLWRPTPPRRQPAAARQAWPRAA